MSTRGLTFRSIEIQRMPGFERSGFNVSDLSPGVNLIHGPNGSGKTTLARAIRYLLAPQDKAAGRVALRGVLAVNAQVYRVELDAGLARCVLLQDASTAEYPATDVEVVRRQTISLLDLADTDADLAGQLARELAGGFDINQARRKLGFEFQIYNRNSGEVSRFDAARAAYDEARRTQENLSQHETELDQLRDDLERARLALSRQSWLELALKRAESVELAEQARAALSAYPEGMDRVQAAMLVELESERGELESIRREIDAEHARRDQAEQKAAGCGFPAGTTLPAVEDTEQTLRAALQRIDELRSQHEGLSSKFQDRQARRNAAATQLGPEVDPEAASALNDHTVASLFQFAQDANALRDKRRASEVLHEWLVASEGDVVLAEPGDDPETLREGIEHLERWSAAQEAWSRAPGRRADGLLVASTVVLVVVGLLAAIIVHPAWVLAAVVGAGLLIARFAGSGGAALDPRIGPRGDFEARGIEGPTSWTDAEVRATLFQLRKRQIAAAIALEKRLRWDRLDNHRSALLEQERAIDRQRAHWLERLGLDPISYVDPEPALTVLASNLRAVQEAERDRSALEAERDRIAKALQEALADFNRTLEQWGLEMADTPVEASARFLAFEQRRRGFVEAHQVLGDRRRVELQRTAERVDGRLDALFAHARLEPDQEAELRDRVARKADYDEARERLQRFEFELESLDRQLGPREDPSLIDQPVADLRVLVETAKAEASRADDLNRRIAEIETQLNQAKRGHELEARLAQLDQARDALRDLLDEDRDRNLGALLVQELAHRRDDVDLPEVLQRARTLFATITSGRYTLDVSRAEAPAFLALDTASEETLTLEQLSSGTRLQLLLSARIAYLETQERGVCVPLVLDETLGNSDERRAEAIIEAALALCRSGRQIFYLTAQHDEVAKWRTILDRCGEVPHQLIDLAEVRRLSPSERVPELLLTPAPRIEVPAPDPALDGDLDAWLAYGRKLDIPAFNPHDRMGQCHLWYALAEPKLLHSYLRDSIDHWGQLRTLVEEGLTKRLASNHPAYQAATAAIDALEQVGHLWKIGRGLPIDRQVLVDSNAVTNRFIDAIDDLARQVNGDANVLIQELSNNAVRQFRQSMIQRLQDYFLTHGYLDEGARRDPETIRAQVRLQMQRHLESNRLTRERLDHLLDIVLTQLFRSNPGALL